MSLSYVLLMCFFGPLNSNVGFYRFWFLLRVDLRKLFHEGSRQEDLGFGVSYFIILFS